MRRRKSSSTHRIARLHKTAGLEKATVISQWYQSLLQHNPDGILVLNKTGNVLASNPAAEQILSYTKQEINKCANFTEIIPHEDLEKASYYFREALGGEPHAFDMKMRHKDGYSIDVSTKLVPMFVSGRVAGVFGIFKNISEQIKADLELRKAQELIESFVNHSSDSIVVSGLQGEIIRTNDAFRNLFPVEQGGYVGRNLQELPNYLNRSTLEHIMINICNGKHRFNMEINHVRAGGEPVVLDMQTSPISDGEGNVSAYSGVFRDITAYKDMEHLLREGQQQYKLIAENMTDLICLLDEKHTIQFMSPSSSQILGYPPEAMLGTKAEEWVEESERKKLEVLSNKNHMSTTLELNYIRPDGTQIVLECHSVPVNDEVQGKVYLSVVSRDITKRKHAELALAEAEAKYRVLVEEAMVGVYLCQDDHFLYINPRFCEFLNYTSEELKQHPVEHFIVPEDLALFRENLRIGLSGERKSVSYVYRLYRKDGSIAELEGNGSFTMFNGRPAIIGTIMDVTERNKTEEMLRKSDRLSVVGQLAAGVAHEIRNPLTSLKGFVHLLKSRSHEFRDYLDIMSSELDRINYIVSEFMLVAKPQGSIQYLRNHAVDIMDQVISLLSSQAALYNVQFIIATTTDELYVMCDENQMKQVYINILKNAVESMPRGGIVRIDFSKRPEDKIRIRIVDQGEGIPEERMPQLGEPFYTTKEKGTGLGLMVCYKIIESHGGRLRIHSVVSEGTTVDIELPLTP
ncbi:PAS domain-containing sensor histidine kinase [Paenibacillus swuensis]|uniref:PAS domain-containing sensor histidine kinase n=1 Tax=Paenibacillus swuensis TaxID=1178515 RepID=UPI000838D6EE|nr:PAS domain-containing sensor histidine kinase [Paenibacillus swuensis]